MKPRNIYRIQLCSGEIRRWQYLGVDEQERAWWRDMENGDEFAETSLMYAWQIIDEAGPDSNSQDDGAPQ